MNNLQNNSIENIMLEFNCNKYDAEKLYNKVRLELILIAEDLHKDFTNKNYNRMTHKIINIQIRENEYHNIEYDNLDEIANDLRTISDNIIDKIIEN